MSCGHTSTPKRTFGKRKDSKKKDLERVKSNNKLISKYK